MPEPITISPEAAIPTQPTPKPQCRAIRTDGHRCRGIALAGLHLCYAHYHHRFPSLADPDHLSVPLLEDAASIQLLMTQVAHGLLSNKLDPARARTAIWAAQVAAYTLPRPARLKDPEPQGDPVHRIGFDHESLISADTAPGENLANLNYLCHAPATTDEIWETLDTPHSVNQPPIDQRYIDPWHCAPPPQPIPAQYNVPPPPPPVPRPNHESGLPCHCPPCEERLQSHIRRFEVRPRKKLSAHRQSPLPIRQSHLPRPRFRIRLPILPPPPQFKPREPRHGFHQRSRPGARLPVPGSRSRGNP